MVNCWEALMGRMPFESLRVYQLSEKLADLAWDMVSKWGGLARDSVGKQMVRAADGVGANISEGTGRYHYKDNRRFVRMARGSLYETTHWLSRAYRRNLLNDEQVRKFKPLIDELGPKLNAYLKSIGKDKPIDN
jgi:four helix bundle protein